MLNHHQKNQLELAKETVNLIEAYVKQAKIRPPVTLDSYIDYIKQKAKIVNKDPLNFVVLNVIRRILALSRQKYNEEGPNRGQSHQERQFKELKDAIQRGEYKTKQELQPQQQDAEGAPPEMRRSQRQESFIEETPQGKAILNNYILAAIGDTLEELTTCQEEINHFASEHFFSNEIILVYEYSSTVLHFLLQAKKVRNIEIIVVKNETSNYGELMALELSKHQLRATVIPFTNTFALMQRINAVLKNGGLLMHPGTLMISLAAKQFSVPVIALSGVHKITPKYAFDQNTFNDLLSPLQISADAEALKSNYIGVKYDYVPPEYITLYITNLGQFTPENIYQLFDDVQDIQDDDM